MVQKLTELLSSEAAGSSDSDDKKSLAALVESLPPNMKDSADGSTMLDSLRDLQTRLSEASKETDDHSDEGDVEVDIDLLVKRLKEMEHTPNERQSACRTIAKLSWDSTHARKLAAVGAVQELTRILEDLCTSELTSSSTVFSILRALGNVTFVVGNSAIIEAQGMERLLQLCWQVKTDRMLVPFFQLCLNFTDHAWAFPLLAGPATQTWHMQLSVSSQTP